MVEDIKPFGAEFQLESFRQREGLGDSRVQVPSAEAAEHIPARHVAGIRTEVRDPQHWIERRLISCGQRQNRVLVRPDVLWSMCARARYRSGWHIPRNTVARTSVQRVSCIEYGEWHPRPGSKDAHECPAAQY